MEPQRNYGENEAKRVIAIYGPELALMAAAAIVQNPDLDPPGAIIYERGTEEGDEFLSQLDPRVPIRIVEDGLTLRVVSRRKLRSIVANKWSRSLPFLQKEEFAGPGRLPILAICRDGGLMGVAAMPEG